MKRPYTLEKIKKIIYIGDPMCSWCWGFAPVIKGLVKDLGAKTSFELRVGNLRNGHPWNDAFKTYLAQHWNDVALSSSQPFNHKTLQREQFDYNTEPACRMVCAIRSLNPTKTLEMFETLQHAFYHEAKDITDTEVLISLAIQIGFETPDIRSRFHSQEMYDAVKQDRAIAHTYGVNSFPSLVIIDTEGHLSILKGYRNDANLRQLLGF